MIPNPKGGGAYVTVHTTEYPAGKIRGQIEPIDPDEVNEMDET